MNLDTIIEPVATIVTYASVGTVASLFAMALTRGVYIAVTELIAEAIALCRF